ncbi:MAG: cell division topological specificity factor MinE [Defluviitaleaceae bacterium]|nr:cell division topological specificity factor MinE [Defluviitaleaceae bacterium]MCL2836805.1 cell division topological specificity factor MinE [Defluviitaleaceae bacterium]
MFQLFTNKKKKSKDTAKSRLKLVLTQDRLNCSPEMLEMMKTDILKVIANYMDFDENEMDIQIAQSFAGEDGKPVLVANIPVKALRKVSPKR